MLGLVFKAFSQLGLGHMIQLLRLRIESLHSWVQGLECRV